LTLASKEALVANNVRVAVSGTGEAVVDGVDLVLRPGEILGLVGESGSGKTTTALSLFGYTADGLQQLDGTITAGDQGVANTDELKSVRGKLISYVPQNPGTALNPSMRVAAAIADVIRTHRSRDADPEAVARQMEIVGLPGTFEFGRRYPHQLSGGQQQRVCIASALAGDPAVVVLDEPTTGLDVVTQARILDELVRLRDEQSVAMLYITHDLAAVAQVANRIAVMYAGRIVESGPALEVLSRPRHPYTQGLIAATPDHLGARNVGVMEGIAPAVGEWPTGCPFAPRCPYSVDACTVALPAIESIGSAHWVRCPEWNRISKLQVGGERDREPAATLDDDAIVLEVTGLCAEHRGHREKVTAATDVSFFLQRRSCLAIVGESGSGKTTVARAIAGLHPPQAGRVLFDGEELPARAKDRSVEQRRRLQIIFQNPAEALNPRHTVSVAVGRPLRFLRGMSRAETQTEVASLLGSVRLPSRLADRLPSELSGGEKQRVAIARALAARPDVMICDEITSALDVSVQAVVLDLLSELRQELGLALVFITHDIGLVASVADDMLVMQSGCVREQGPTKEVLRSPTDAYTQRLIHASPSLAAAISGWGIGVDIQ
jgi:peptide/nickel transport system ATP-binding protein